MPAQVLKRIKRLGREGAQGRRKAKKLMDDWSLQRAEEVTCTSIAALLACCILAQLCMQELVSAG